MSAGSAMDAYKAAMYALDEIFNEQETVFSIAVAGANFAGEDSVCERRLFDVIRKMTESIQLITALRVEMATLAQHAGLNVEVQS